MWDFGDGTKYQPGVGLHGPDGRFTAMPFPGQPERAANGGPAPMPLAVAMVMCLVVVLFGRMKTRK